VQERNTERYMMNLKIEATIYDGKTAPELLISVEVNLYAKDSATAKELGKKFLDTLPQV
jgi:hypothetical protein